MSSCFLYIASGTLAWEEVADFLPREVDGEGKRGQQGLIVVGMTEKGGLGVVRLSSFRGWGGQR